MNNNIFELAKKTHTVEELISLAKNAGFELSVDEAKQYLAQAECEIGPKDLDQVSGGLNVKLNPDFNMVARF